MAPWPVGDVHIDWSVGTLPGGTTRPSHMPLMSPPMWAELSIVPPEKKPPVRD